MTETAPHPLTICIVEDDSATRENLATLLGQDPALRCVGAFPDAETALREIPRVQPEVALVDINLPGMSGIECVARLSEAAPAVSVLILTTYEHRELIFNSLRAGAKGYLLKNMPPEDLLQAVRQVHAGGAPMSMHVARKVVDFFAERRRPASDVGSLSKREHEVLTLLAQGYLYKEIADKLGVSLNTVRTYLQRVYEKLHVQSRTEATAKFLGSR